MKKEAKLLYSKAIDSLVLSVEHFNRPSDQGRVHTVLILLDHAFEMLLKASILHRGGKIRERRAKQTIGFDACLRKALSDGKIKFLSNEQVLTLQVINSLRDAAQHHLLDISEEHLYIQAQSGVTLFRDITKQVLGKDLYSELPARVLPLSTIPPVNIETLFDNEVGEIRKLLSPRSRRVIEATAKVRSLSILESSIQGQKLQPSQSDLNKICDEIRKGTAWDKIFPSVAAITITSKGYGPAIDLRISKKEGTPMVVVPEGTPGAAVVAIKRVDDLGFYSLGRDDVADKVGLSGPRTTAVVRYLKLQGDADCFKAIQIGKTRFNRYSMKAVEKIKEALKTIDLDSVWNLYGDGGHKKRTQ